MTPVPISKLAPNMNFRFVNGYTLNPARRKSAVCQTPGRRAAREVIISINPSSRGWSRYSAERSKVQAALGLLARSSTNVEDKIAKPTARAHRVCSRIEERLELDEV